jgi:protein required for attachment to host cells
MREHTAYQPQPIVTWILIADDKEAQIYDCHKTLQPIPLGGANPHHYYNEKSSHELSPVMNGLLKSESINDYQIGHDRRGTASSSNSPTHNTYEPHGDIDGELKRRFAESIAHKLQQACENKLFDQLILVAPPKMIGELREHMSKNIDTKIVATLPKDLRQYHGKELMKHLSDTLTEAHVE